MAKIFCLQNSIVRFIKTKEEETRYGVPLEFDDIIEFDGATNIDVINGLDTDWNNHSVEGGQLLRSGVPVTINPPGEEWIADETAVSSRTGWKDLGDWIVTFTPDEAELYVRNQIFDGIEPSALDIWIDTNVTDLASARTALKFIGANIMTIRTILGIIAKVILYIRDILIKRL